MKYVEPIRTFREKFPDREAFVIGLAFLWGFWYMLPWDAIGANKVFHILKDICPIQQVWGIAVIGIVAATLIGAKYPRYKSLYKTGLFFITMIWLFITVMVTLSNPAATSSVTYGSIFLYSLRAYLRTK